MIKLNHCTLLFALLLAFVAAHAENQESEATPPSQSPQNSTGFLGFERIESNPLNEVWIDSGFESYHYDRNKNLNENNYGLGAEYRFSTVSALTIGRFYNSDRAYSDYAGVYYQPIKFGPFRFGAVAGGFNGYPHMKNGGWFLAAVPMISAEWNRVGLNLAIVPTLQNRLYGAISLQIKVKLWD